MTILGIETSCDETAVTLIDADVQTQMNADNPRASAPLSAYIRVLADKTLSQIEIHKEYGGVFPNMAKREHLKNLPLMLPLVLKEAGFSEEARPIDAIAVTIGPGLEPCLWTGITFAEELAKKWRVPIVPVNHMEGHVFSALLKAEKTADERGPVADRRRNEISNSPNYLISKPEFPALALLISGGHTELVLVRDWFTYEVIGETRDDAVGEAFDKVARLLGLPYPGGPEISRLAEQERIAIQGPTLFTRSDLVKLPRPMLHSGDFDFSFSGLKTAVLYLVKKLPQPLDEPTRMAIAKEFEDAVTEVLVAKTKAALEQYGAKTLLLGGGVIANTHIRRAFEELTRGTLQGPTLVSLHIPAPELTTDNALMIAVAGFLRLTLKNGSIKAQNEKMVAKGGLRLDEK